MIDTLTISKVLQESGLEEKPSEAIAKAIHQKEEGLATSAELNSLKWNVSLFAALMLALHGITIAGIVAILLRG